MGGNTCGDFTPQHFNWDCKDHVGVITLNRPERKNPLTVESYGELRDLFQHLVKCTDVKTIVLRGAGGNFCSGGDVHDIIAPLVAKAEAGDLAGLLAFTKMTGDLVKAMRACPQPIIAAVDGVCVGAGAILAMAADIRLGTRRANVAFLFVRVGLCGADMGACNILPRIIGAGRAADLLFTGRSMGGEEAERCGFFNRLCEPDGLHAEAESFAGALARGPSFAHTMTKACLHREWSMSIDDAVSAEAEAQAACMMTKDFGRAYRAFVAKTQPSFQGD